MQTEVLQYKGAPLTVRVFERFDYVDISRATPYGGSTRFKLQGVTVTAEPYFPGYDGSTKHIVISPGGENLTPILGAIGGKWPESRFLACPQQLIKMVHLNHQNYLNTSLLPEMFLNGILRQN